MAKNNFDSLKPIQISKDLLVVVYKEGSLFKCHFFKDEDSVAEWSDLVDSYQVIGSNFVFYKENRYFAYCNGNKEPVYLGNDEKHLFYLQTMIDGTISFSYFDKKRDLCQKNVRHGHLIKDNCEGFEKFIFVTHCRDLVSPVYASFREITDKEDPICYVEEITESVYLDKYWRAYDDNFEQAIYYQYEEKKSRAVYSGKNFSIFSNAVLTAKEGENGELFFLGEKGLVLGMKGKIKTISEEGVLINEKFWPVCKDNPNRLSELSVLVYNKMSFGSIGGYDYDGEKRTWFSKQYHRLGAWFGWWK